MSINSLKQGLVITPFDFVEQRHFIPDIELQQSMRLFKKSICMVEIEVFSFCNRKCWFCSNSRIDRRSKNYYMDEDCYLRVLRDLAKIEYEKMVSFSRYNEPLADKIILTRLSQASKILPQAQLHLNTNGDHLTCEYLNELHFAGLRSLNIQAYLTSKTYSDEEAYALCDLKIHRLNIPLTLARYEPDSWLEYVGDLSGMKVRLYARNFSVNGTDRGGLVDIEYEGARTSPCLSPFYHFYVDYNGSIMPCCNLRSDAPEHKDFVLYKLTGEENEIYKAYTSSKAVTWRRSLICFEKKKYPCESCRFKKHPATPEIMGVLNKWCL